MVLPCWNEWHGSLEIWWLLRFCTGPRSTIKTIPSISKEARSPILFIAAFSPRQCRPYRWSLGARSLMPERARRLTRGPQRQSSITIYLRLAFKPVPDYFGSQSFLVQVYDGSGIVALEVAKVMAYRDNLQDPRLGGAWLSDVLGAATYCSLHRLPQWHECAKWIHPWSSLMKWSMVGSTFTSEV